MCSYKGIYFTAAPSTLLLIPGTPGAVFGITATPTSTENVGAYLAIAVFAHINIVCEWVTKIVKDVWVINY